MKEALVGFSHDTSLLEKTSWVDEAVQVDGFDAGSFAEDDCEPESQPFVVEETSFGSCISEDFYKEDFSRSSDGLVSVNEAPQELETCSSLDASFTTVPAIEVSTYTPDLDKEASETFDSFHCDSEDEDFAKNGAPAKAIRQPSRRYSRSFLTDMMTSTPARTRQRSASIIRQPHGPTSLSDKGFRVPGNEDRALSMVPVWRKRAASVSLLSDSASRLPSLSSAESGVAKQTSARRRSSLGDLNSKSTTPIESFPRSHAKYVTPGRRSSVGSLSSIMELNNDATDPENGQTEVKPRSDPDAPDWRTAAMAPASPLLSRMPSLSPGSSRPSIRVKAEMKIPPGEGKTAVSNAPNWRALAIKDKVADQDAKRPSASAGPDWRALARSTGSESKTESSSKALPHVSSEAHNGHSQTLPKSQRSGSAPNWKALSLALN